MKTSSPYRSVLLLLLFITTSQGLLAHTINYSLEQAPIRNVVGFYLPLGIEHIVPNGLDHVLFVLGLCLLSTRIKTILVQATAFTIAHCITLLLSLKGWVAVPSAIIEPIIALSIFFVAVENLLLNELRAGRLALVFFFGLIHGMGFASVLQETGLPRDRFLTAVLAFNLGVELGQVLVIALVFAVLIVPFRNKTAYRKWIVFPVSTGIAVVALWWTLQRM